MVRPRTTTPPYDDLIALGEELLFWATEPVPESEQKYRFRFAQWYSLEKCILDKEWDLMLQKPEFRVYYERARVALANKITDGVTLKEGIAQRFLRTYVPEVKREENEKLKYESSLKNEENKALFSLSDLKKAAVDGELSQ